MTLQNVRIFVAVTWFLVAAATGVVTGVSSPGSLLTLVVFGVIPPLAILVLWNVPPQSLTERIREGRR